MKPHRLSVLPSFVVLLAFVSCQTPTTSSPTKTPLPSETPLPTSTPTPTATPMPVCEKIHSSRTDPQPAIGLNKFDLLMQYLGTASGGGGSPNYQEVTESMGQKAIVDAAAIGVNYFRVSITGYFPAAYDSSGDLDQWRQNPDVYWSIVDKMMSNLQENCIRIVPVFVWNATQFPAMAQENLTQMMTNPDSKSYILLTAYIEDFINRYKSHPMLYFYELTNELNLSADLDLAKRCLDGPYPGLCPPTGNFSSDEMIAFTSRLAEVIRKQDSAHPISSGFGLPQSYTEHLRRQPEWSPAGPDWTHDSFEEFHTNLINIHKGVDIVSIHFYPPDMKGFRARNWPDGDPLAIIKGITDEIGKPLFIGEFADENPFISQDSNALFTQNVINEIVKLGIPYSAPWIWEAYLDAPYKPDINYNLESGYSDLIITKLKQANEQLGNQPPETQIPDTTPPLVILTWPLEGAGMAGKNELIYAVASDNSSLVSKVEFWLDDQLLSTTTIPPYQIMVDMSKFAIGTHTISVKAYDASGNWSQDTGTAIHIDDLSGSISASPNPVVIDWRHETGGTTVMWFAKTPKGSEVWVSVDGETAQLMSCATELNSYQFVPWIKLGHKYQFLLYATESCPSIAPTVLLDTFDVTATGP